ncbi:MAG: exodeoxyribonuclease VII small subunit [Saprospiraceae bacterium]|nr:exodeoxyribonuclease VII small subunit [Saprospiraceae bacterium]
MNKEVLTYDAAYSELNDILTYLQTDEVSLDDLSEKLRRASELSEFCKLKLRTIEKEIEKISPASEERKD